MVGRFKEVLRMKFDFTTEYDRRGMDALAVDGLGLIPGKSPDRPKKGFDVIPMWIADMSFPTVPTVISAMQKRLEHPIFGYIYRQYEKKFVDVFILLGFVFGWGLISDAGNPFFGLVFILRTDGSTYLHSLYEFRHIVSKRTLF